MLWAFCAVVALFLFIAFPRTMFTLLAVTGIGIAAVIVHQNKEAERFRAEQESVVLTASLDVAACQDPNYPVLIVFGNYSARVATEISFTLAGYRPHHSKPVVDDRRTSDRILKPGGMHSSCWSIPTKYGEAVLNVEAAKALEWRTKTGYVTFD